MWLSLYTIHITNMSIVCSQAPTMADLMSQVATKTPTKWYEVGIQLKIDTSILDAFEQQTRDHMRLYSKVFNQWKKEKKLRYTWDTIINALDNVGEKETVIAIRTLLREGISSVPFDTTNDSTVHGKNYYCYRLV